MASDDEYSELTDLSDDDYGPSSSSKRKRRATSPATGGYRIRKALKAPRATTYTAQALYDQMHSDDIKLDPEYQRDVVWPDTKMVGLIDSVFRNFYVPPVIFAAVAYDDGSEKKICIDGKQRLTSIQRFMDGLIPHKDPLTGEKLWFTDTGSKTRRKVLPEKIRTLFRNKQIVCVEYQDVTDDDEREIFQRVQLGMALTPAEKLQVINTPRATFVRSLLTHFFSAPSSSNPKQGGGSLTTLDFERTRGADFRCLAQTVFCLHTPLAQLNGAGALAKLEKFLTEPARFSAAFEGQVMETLRVMGEMAADKDERVRGVFRAPAKLAPVEFVMTGVLVGVHMGAAGCGAKEGREGERGREEKEREGRKRLGEGIRKMREDVREHHVDIRMNDRVARTMVEFIRLWKPDAASAAAAPSSAAGKRKHGMVDTGKEEEGEIPEEKPRMKFKKLPPAAAVPASTSTGAIPTRPTGLPAKPPLLPTPTSTPTGGMKPDRMAVLRAAKMQMQNQATASTPSSSSPYTTAPMPSYSQNQSQHGMMPSQGGGFQNNMPYTTQQQQYNLEMQLMGGRRGSAGGGGSAGGSGSGTAGTGGGGSGGGWGAADAGWASRAASGGGGGGGSAWD